jgi:hypothetical protein
LAAANAGVRALVQIDKSVRNPDIHLKELPEAEKDWTALDEAIEKMRKEDQSFLEEENKQLSKGKKPPKEACSDQLVSFLKESCAYSERYLQQTIREAQGCISKHDSLSPICEKNLKGLQSALDIKRSECQQALSRCGIEWKVP